MSWCPKCKNEYRAGITICPDCNEELLEELSEEITIEFVPLIQTTDEAFKTKLVNYLIHCGHKIKEEPYTEDNGEELRKGFAVFVPKEEYQEAMQEIQAALAYEAKQQAGEEDLKPRNHTAEPSSVYVDAKSRYDEYKSSGIMFLGFAVLFFVFGILNVLGILKLMSAGITLIMIFAIAIGFAYVGVTSLLKTGTIKEEVSFEKKTTDSIMEYLKTNFTKDKIKNYISFEETDSELLYFQIMELMKEKVTEKFPNQEENYIDSLLEDYYNTLDI